MLTRDICRVLAVAFILLMPHRAFAEITYVNKIQSKRVIVFVHGLWGNPKDTFKADGASASWPELMARDQTLFKGVNLSSYAIAVVNLPTGSGARVSLSQIATLFRGFLNDYGLLDAHEDIIFIGHSLGGLVIKQMLLEELTEKKDVLLKKTSGIFLFSVPSQGAPAANFVAKLPDIVPGRLVADLKTIDINTYLNNLENSWKSFIQAQPNPRTLRIVCAFETEPVGSLVGVVVVPEQYTTTTCDNRPHPTTESHITIVKPAAPNSPVYIWTKARIAELRPIISTLQAPPSYVDSKGAPIARVTPQTPLGKESANTTDNRRTGGSGFTGSSSFMGVDIPPGAFSKKKSDGTNQNLSVLDFVSQFLTIWNQGKAEDIRYAERVDFYNEGFKTRAEAIKASGRVFVDCPVRSYAISESANISIKPKHGEVGVINAIVPVRYRLECKAKTLAGTGKFDLDLRRDGYSFNVVGVNLVDRRDTVIKKK